MNFPTTYKCLDKNIFENENICLLPIRFEDRLDIMNWRNDQVYQLRQAVPITIESQDKYFKHTVSYRIKFFFLILKMENVSLMAVWFI